MLDQEALTYIIGILVIIGTGFSAFNYLRKPQERSEINDAVVDEKIANLKLNTDEKITGVKDLIVNLRDNHLKHMDEKFDKHIEKQIENEKLIAENFTKVFVLLDERLPNKK